ncbi:MAG TPA: class I SAM-dependent methyltransferase [Patescibacteria group bacterium]|nr:class I SAM-dependent methyltransferase [Patescibacteria group bacterium]
MTKTQVEKHFDKIAVTYDKGKNKYSFYYNNLKKLLYFLIPRDKKVLEIGCGTGDLLAGLRPKYGYGFDISSKMIEIAKQKYQKSKKLRFSTKWPDTWFDYVFMSDVIEHLENPQSEFKRIVKLMNSKTVFIITMANPIWESLLIFWEKMGWKMKEGKHRRIDYKEIKTKVERSGLKIIKHDYKLLIPVQIPFVTTLANKYLERPFKKFAFIEYIVAVKA